MTRCNREKLIWYYIQRIVSDYFMSNPSILCLESNGIETITLKDAQTAIDNLLSGSSFPVSILDIKFIQDYIDAHNSDYPKGTVAGEALVIAQSLLDVIKSAMGSEDVE